MLESQLVRKKERERERKEGWKEGKKGRERKEGRQQQVSQTSLENLCLKELKPFFKTRENRFSCLVFHKNIS